MNDQPITIATMSDEQIAQLLTEVKHPTEQETVERRKDLQARWLALRERHLDAVKERIAETYNDPEVITAVQSFAREIWNPIRRIVRRVAKGYQARPHRKLTKGTQDDAKKLAKLLKAVQWNATGKKANRYQVGLNCVVALVLPRKDPEGQPTLGFDLVTGAYAEVVQHDGAPYGATPAVMAYALVDRGRRQGRITSNADAKVYAMVDRERWRFFNASLEKVGEDVEHGIGRFPGEPLRLEPADGDTDDDWWGADVGRGLSQVVSDVGMTAATMNWTRKNQCRNLVSILESTDGGQASDDGGDDDQGQHLGHPEEVLHLSGANLALQVNDLDVPIKSFREHIEYMTGEVSEVITGASSALTDPQPGLEQADTASVQAHAALRELQADQVDALEEWERRMVYIIVRMARAHGMDAPDPELVRDNLEIHFPALPFLDTPAARLAFYRDATAFGVADQVDYMIEKHGVDEETAHEMVMAKAKRRAVLHKLLATHNTNARTEDAEGSQEPGEARAELPGERPEARTGRQGGRARPSENDNAA